MQQIAYHFKRCIKCLDLLHLDEFYSHKQMRDGKLNKCKDCCKKESLKNREKNLSSVREYDGKRGARQTAKYQREYRKKYPQKYKAKNLVNNSLRDGKISKAKRCDSCNFELRLCAHHDDYARPLDIRWLCQSCHKQWHSINGEGKNGI